jgi:hypothetical protein
MNRAVVFPLWYGLCFSTYYTFYDTSIMSSQSFVSYCGPQLTEWGLCVCSQGQKSRNILV